MVCFECHDCSRGPIFHIELAKNMFDVFTDGTRLCAENNTDIVVTFALCNPEEDFDLAGRQLERSECPCSVLIGLWHRIHLCSG